MTASVCVVFHSPGGHTERLARAVHEGAEAVEGTVARLVPVAALHETSSNADDEWRALDAADALIFGCPTHMGTVSTEMKHFMEQTIDHWRERRWVDKLAAGFTVSGSFSGDKLNCLTTLALYAAQQGMIWVNMSLKAGTTRSTSTGSELNRLGGYIGVMSQANLDEGPETAPPAADIETARFLGERVARTAVRWRRGANS